MKTYSFSKSLLLIAGMFAAQFCSAQGRELESTQSFKEHTVHYSIFHSNMVQPEVAAALNLTRGSGRMLVNIAVVDNENSNAGGQAAKVSGTATNLMQQQRKLEFITVREQNVVYYLAPLRTTNREVWRFVINVDPEGAAGPYQVKFERMLYVD